MFKALVYHGIVKKLDNFDKFFPKHILIDNFKKQVNIIRKKYRVLSLEEFNYRWQNKKLKNDEILIFFDDGYKSVLNGAEILEGFKIPAIFSISSDLVNKNYSWVDDIEKALIHTKKKTIKFNNSFFDISTAIRKFKVILDFKKNFQSISTDIIIKKLENLIRACEINPREIIQEKFEIISWNQIEQIKSINFFSVVHHSHLHYPMSKFSDQKKLSQDIKINTEILRREVGVEPYMFVYPFGLSNHYNKTVKKVLKDYGFKLAFTTEGKKINYEDSFGIPRIIIT